MRNLGKAIKKIVVGLLAVVFFAFAITMTILLWSFNKYGVTQFENISLVVLKNKVSSDKYNKGDLIIVEGRKISELKVGDEIFAYQVDSQSNVTIDFGKVGEVYLDDNAFAYENGSFYDSQFIIGEATKVYEKIGTYLAIIESQWGFLFIILLPSFMIFVYEIYNLIVEIKYGDEDSPKKKEDESSDEQPKEKIKEEEKDFLKE